MRSNTLSSLQKDWLQNLWKAHRRDLIHVQSASEHKKTSSKNSISVDAYKHAARVTAFLTTFLENCSRDSSSTSLKRIDDSSLCEYASHALSSTEETHTITASRGLTSSESNVSLKDGRHVIVVHQPEFLDELNRFECHGETPSAEFLRDCFGAFLYHVPNDALTVLGCAMALAVIAVVEQQQQSSETETATADIVRFTQNTQYVVRFVHVQPEVPMMHIKTGLVGKFVTVTGHVVKARPKRLRVATADFSCGQCGQTTTLALDRGIYQTPTQCAATDKCRSRKFEFVRTSARYVNVQDLRLQEAPDENTLQAGRTPRQLEVEMTHDLVDQCRAGDMVLVACTVAAVNTAVAQGKAGKRAKESSAYKLYLQGHSVTTLSETTTQDLPRKKKKAGATPASRKSVVYTQAQLQSITQLCHADHRMFGLVERRAFPFDLLVRSLCPSIIGHHEVKAGILLCLLGGTPSCKAGSEAIRSNSHILIVGDPGMGKSQMLLAASQLATRSVYVGGNTSSTTGLTVTLTKEENGEAGMEAGALVLADQGVCCIDEFDKMAKSHQDGLLEAMEQQQVSIAKAGVVASLPARCSIVAAANPRHGSYTLNKSVGENLNLAKPILSRFDLVFILRDRADKAQDRSVSSNVMNLYCRGSQNSRNQSSLRQQQQRNEQTQATNDRSAGSRMPLSERLAWVNGFQKESLPASLVRDYIAYAREYCKPKLTAEAAAVLKEYFMELRYPEHGHRNNDTVPITTRQLEALIRLCQARAKACLREFCLKEDALDVVELMSKSVDQVHSDDNGGLDRTRGGAGGTSNRKMKKAFVNELGRLVGGGTRCRIDDLRRIADKVGCGLNEFQSTVEEMRSNGILLRKGDGVFEVALV